MGSEARTRLALAAVLLAALLSFNQLFAPGDYPGPALLGMLVAGALAMGARRLGLGAVPTLLASLAGLAWYVAFIFETEATLFGLPTPTALAGAARAVARAYGFSHLDYAPVPVRPGYVVLLVAGTWVATTLGELATFRWKRPLLAALPAVVLFSLAIILGSGRGAPALVVLFLASLLTFWGIESSHRVRAWGRWVTAWSTGPEGETDGVSAGIARRMGAGCVAIAILSPLFLPALGDGLLSWRTDIGEGLGRGDGRGGGRIDPLVSIAPSLVNQGTQELFRVTAPQGTYWRLVALPFFDGETWRPAPDDDESAVSDSGRLGGVWEPDVDVRSELDQEIRLLGLRGRYLPAAAQPQQVVLEDAERDNDLRYHPLTGDLRIVGEVEEGLAYRVVSAVPDASFRALRDAPVGHIDPLFSDPPVLHPAVVSLRDRWIEGYESPYERLVAIQEALRGADYTYSTPRPEEIPTEQEASTDKLAEFLLVTKSGYCQQFATAFAALSRSLGYPTRVVVGFLPGEEADDGDFVVRGTDAHAWPEVFFDGYGWVRFEPTPRVVDNPTIVPAYTLAPSAGAGAILGNDGGVGNRLRDDTHLSPARRLNDPGVGAGTAAALARQEEGRGGGGGGADEEENAPWERTFRRLAAALALAALAALTAVPALKARRVRRLYRGAGTPRAIAAAAFAEFMLEAGELAVPRGAAESARAYALRVARLKDLSEPQALRLASLYERAVYGRPEAPLDGREARKLARDLRVMLWHKASWWERGLRLFSPRTLLG